MFSHNLHPEDIDLLLAAEGELSSARSAKIRTHLAQCATCQARLATFDSVMADLSGIVQQSLAPQIRPIDESLVRLKAHMAGAVQDGAKAANSNAGQRQRTWRRFLQPFMLRPMVTATCTGIFLVLLAAVFGAYSTNPMTGRILAKRNRAIVPDQSLTPGSVRNVALSDLCSMDREEPIREISLPLRKAVLQKYGMAAARPDDYEIDLLISPGLGGTDDPRNLWPEPYAPSSWNARDKDDLEEHLHNLVCSNKLELATAQNEISHDWIAAYKKYFHTDRPRRPAGAGLLPSKYGA